MSQYTVSIFLILFGCNFSVYYLLLVGRFRQILKSAELKVYIAVVVIFSAVIFLSLESSKELVMQDYTTEGAFRHAVFQTVSALTTAGFTTTDYSSWPMLAKALLMLLGRLEILPVLLLFNKRTWTRT